MTERLAVVTGAARGIGAAVAAELADAGWSLLLVDACAPQPPAVYPMPGPEDLTAVARGCVAAGADRVGAGRDATMEVTVRDVTSTEVVAVRRGASFKEMAASLRQYRISAFPVIDDDQKLICAVSEADPLAKEAWPGATGSPHCCIAESTRRPRV